MSTNPTARAWIELDAGALRENYARLHAAVGARVGMIPMVKADGYGLGVGEVVARLEALEPAAYGVATVDEGVALRRLGIARTVIVCSPAPPGAIPAALEAGLELAVGDLGTAEAIAGEAWRLGAVAAVHVEIDTGMGRAGVDWTAAPAWFPRFRALLGPGLRWAGCFTHLHSADADPASITLQWDRFSEVLAAARPPTGVLRHILNSSGILRVPEHALDAVRPGIFLYGGRAGPDLPAPERVWTLHARVVHIREAEEGSTLGYGATHRAERPERWATLAIGYGDGLPRALGNRGHALVRGVRVPLVGRISMDVAVMNITGVDGVGVGDVATLIGRDGDEEITVDEVATHAGTISYEVMTGLSARLPRIWRDVDGP